jgi:hypothetical protein
METLKLTSQIEAIEAIFIKANEEAQKILNDIKLNNIKNDNTESPTNNDKKKESEIPSINKEECSYVKALIGNDEKSLPNTDKQIESTNEEKKSPKIVETQSIKKEEKNTTSTFKVGDIPLCLFGLKCTNDKCTWYHGTRDCKHGLKCNKVYCKFKHDTLRGLSPAHKCANYEPKRTCVNVNDIE